MCTVKRASLSRWLTSLVELPLLETNRFGRKPERKNGLRSVTAIKKTKKLAKLLTEPILREQARVIDNM